ncbi:hypothetical protein [Nocardia nepalensis]|uniref:hypothetical protein n=1 Tax=Nocardia nepalensis TaxID=3375448 RepID=UPI003B6706EE
MTQQLRQELIALSRRRMAIDSVVKFAQDYLAFAPEPQIDEDATALVLTCMAGGASGSRSPRWTSSSAHAAVAPLVVE